jgi:hypothetical protein
VLFIGDSTLYKGEMLGPKILVMVEHPETLPKSMILPKFDKEGNNWN